MPVHPLQFGVITADRGVREFQVLQRGDGVQVRVVVREGQPPAEVAERLRERVGERLAALGVSDPHVEVEPCAALERPPAGKLQLVVAESRGPGRQPRLRRVSSSVQHVRIREVGPRDGFQNEPEVIATADKVRLIEMLARTGLRRLEVTSFVRADVIPQLADAREVLEAIDVPEDVSLSVLIPNERGLENALELRDRFHEVNVFMSATESHNMANVNRSVEESLAGLEAVLGRAREAGLRCEAVISVAFGCPYEGHVAARARVRDRAPARRGGRAGDRLRRHHRHGQPGPGPRVLPRPRATRSARTSS